MTTENSSLRRVRNNFWAELIEINKIRQDQGKPKISLVKLTSLFPRHTLWSKIKLDAINYEEDTYE